MNTRATFEFPLTPVEIAILKQTGIFRGPTGVLVDIMIINPPRGFGFKEAGSRVKGFNNGNLFGGFQ
jgi:hypothetical protein